ncbi:MAG: hypothetical protein HY231_13390 [Acidobacteria bacterium]|nr:hypothetical protein [Acidobacteriota bacterium]
MMKRVFTFFLFALLTFVPAFAQDKATPAAPAAALPTAEQIVDKFIQATGGKAAREKLTSRVSKGQFEVPAMGATGPIEIYAKAPNKTISIVTIESFGVFQQGYDGANGWAADPQNGLRDMQGAELAANKREADFYNDIKMKEYYPKMTVTGKDQVGDKAVYVIEALPAGEGAPEKFYFDTQSGLLLRLDSERETPQGKMKIQAYLDDYKEVDGVKLPFTIRQDSDIISFTIKISEIKHNVAIEDAKFKKPSQ